MNDTLTKQLGKISEKRSKRKKVIVLLLILSLIVALTVAWQLHLTGKSLAGEAFCGIDEHVHTEACIEKNLICTEEHEHTDECYEIVYICGMEEHIHTPECYIDPNEHDGHIDALALEADEYDLSLEFQNSNEIKLTSNITVTTPIVIENGDYHLDLNGFTIMATTDEPLFLIKSTGSLTIADSQEAEETSKDIKILEKNNELDGYANLARLENKRLTYYVTRSDVTNELTGATQETLEERTVTGGGGITITTKQPVFRVDGGELNLEGGMIYGGDNRAIYMVNGATANLNGGYICGFKSDWKNGDNEGGAICTEDSIINLSGTVIAGNESQNGGGIIANRGKINISGGIISGNSALGEYGGGIFCWDSTTVTMTGGYITNNKVFDDDYNSGGAGAMVAHGAMFILQDGYVTGNVGMGGGGGLMTRNADGASIEMTGGYVCSNVAASAEGAGISVERDGTATVLGGYINNNFIPHTEHWGGAGLFCADAATIYIKNALYNDNSAGGFGGGVAGCPTGNLYVYVDRGSGIFDNKDMVDINGNPLSVPNWVEGGTKQGLDQEVCVGEFLNHGHRDFFGAKRSVVMGNMLGGGYAGWEGTADYFPVNVPDGGSQWAENVMGLQANPTQAVKDSAYSEAKLYINGNYSYTHGGGILCNGSLYIGEPSDESEPAHLRIGGKKLLLTLDGEELDLEDRKFKFELLDEEENVLSTAENMPNGTIAFDWEAEYEEAGAYIYFVRETTDSEYPNIVNDNLVRKITVTVIEETKTDHFGNEWKDCIIEKIYIETLPSGATYTINANNNNYRVKLDEGNGMAFKNTTYDVVDSSIKIKANKKLLNSSGGDDWLSDGQFSFELLDENKKLIEKATCNWNGDISFGKLPRFSNPGTYTYYVREFVDKIDNIAYDSTEYKIVVTVAEGEIKLPNGSVSNGNVITSVVVTDQNGNLIQQSNNLSELSYELKLRENEYSFTNRKIESTSVTVNKVWEGKPAESVTVHLLQNGEVKETATLNEGNGWSHTWSGLPTVDGDGKVITYTVEEIAIPGYTASYDYSSSFETVSAWVPVKQIANDNDNHFIVASGNHLLGFSSDTVQKNADIELQTNSLTVGGVTYSSWIKGGAVSNEYIFGKNSWQWGGGDIALVAQNGSMLRAKGSKIELGSGNNWGVLKITPDGLLQISSNVFEGHWGNLESWLYMYYDSKTGQFGVTQNDPGENGVRLYKEVNSTESSSIVTVTNSDKPDIPGYILPATGGIGTYIFTFAGLLLMAIPVLYGLNLRRKHERRTKN